MSGRRLLRIQVDGLPPTVNHLYRSARNGQRYKTAEGKVYQWHVSLVLSTAWRGKKPYALPAGLRLYFFTKDHRKWDIDNRIKAVQDCLSMSGVLEDDRQIEDLHVRRFYGERDYTVIELRGL